MERDERSLQLSEGALATAPQPAPTQQDDAQQCIELKKINIDGVNSIDVENIKSQIRQALDGSTCPTKETLLKIQSDMQQAYIDKGLISARVYFNFRDIGHKRLDIVADEGTLEQVILLDPKTKQPARGRGAAMRKFTAFPFTEGRVLNLRTLEQGIEQMNKLASSRATMQIRPGENAGGSIVLIDNQPLPKNSLGIGYDNNGSKSTGLNRMNATFSRDNLLSLNENIYLNANTTVGENDDKRYSRSMVAALSVPLGYFTFNGSYNYSKYLSSVQGLEADIDSNGNSLNITTSVDYMFARGRNYKTSLGAQLTYKKSNNYVMGEFMATQSRTLSVGSLYLTGTYYSWLGSFYSKLSLNRGLDILGALKDGELKAGTPQAQYTSMGFYLNYSGNIKLLNYSASFDGQYGFDDMFGSEQMMVGSGSIRGFKEGGLSGERGFIIRQDLKAFFANIFGRSQNKHIDMLLGGLYAGVYLDYGYVTPKTKFENGQRGESLAGAGAKLGYYGKYLTADLGWARSLHRPDYIRNEGHVLYASAAVNISF